MKRDQFKAPIISRDIQLFDVGFEIVRDSPQFFQRFPQVCDLAPFAASQAQMTFTYL